MQLRPIAALALTASVALGLASCTIAPPPAQDDAPAPTSQTEQTPPAQEPGSTPAPTQDAETGGSTGAAPVEGWPEVVPVPDGELQHDASTGNQVVGAFSMADAAAAQAYLAELEAAGFVADGEPTEVAGATATAYQGHGHIVGVSTIEAGGTVVLSVAIQQQ